MNPSEKIDVLILNYNTPTDVYECVKNLSHNAPKNLRITVIDNRSSKENLKKLEKALSELDFTSSGPEDYPKALKKSSRIFLKNPKNLGFAKGNNVALRALKEDSDAGWIMLLNPDVRVERNFWNKLLKKRLSDDSIYGFKMVDRQGAYFGWRLDFCGNVRKITDPSLKPDCITAGAILFSKKALCEIGLLPEEYFLYWEDTDWSFRAKGKGFKLKILDDITCTDLGGKSIGRETALGVYYYTLGALKFLSKHDRAKFSCFVLRTLMARVPKNALLLKFSRVGAILRAFADFLRGK